MTTQQPASSSSSVVEPKPAGQPEPSLLLKFLPKEQRPHSAPKGDVVPGPGTHKHTLFHPSIHPIHGHYPHYTADWVNHH